MHLQIKYSNDFYDMDFTTRAGIPTATLFAGILCVTTAFAPIIAPSPMLTFGIILTFLPIHTFLPIITDPLLHNSLCEGGISNSAAELCP